jgi:hypothetical protein
MNRPALEADLTESRRQLQELLDRSEITELANRLGAWLDEKYWDEAPSILTEDAIAKTPGGSVAGDQLAQQARQNHVVPTHHMITNVLIDLDGHRATAGANLIGTFVVGPDGSGPHFQLGERYRFEAIRTPDGWRLSHVESTPVWSVGFAAHQPLNRPGVGRNPLGASSQSGPTTLTTTP